MVRHVQVVMQLLYDLAKQHSETIALSVFTSAKLDSIDKQVSRWRIGDSYRETP